MQRCIIDSRLSTKDDWNKMEKNEKRIFNVLSGLNRQKRVQKRLVVVRNIVLHYLTNLIFEVDSSRRIEVMGNFL